MSNSYFQRIRFSLGVSHHKWWKKGYSYRRWTEWCSICRRERRSWRRHRTRVSPCTSPRSSPRPSRSETTITTTTSFPIPTRETKDKEKQTEIELTWKTVSRLCQKLSKLYRGLSSSELKLKRPPNTWERENARSEINVVVSRSHRIIV